MKKCPACAEEIQDDAIKCKHCGEKLMVSEKSSFQIAEDFKKLKLWQKAILFPFIFFCLLIILGSILNSTSNSPSAQNSMSEQEDLAHVFKDGGIYAGSYLQAVYPKDKIMWDSIVTAKMPDQKDMYLVSGKEKHDNGWEELSDESFEAQITTDYTKDSSGNLNWKMVDLTLSDGHHYHNPIYSDVSGSPVTQAVTTSAVNNSNDNVQVTQATSNVQAVDSAESYTVNVPNSQGGYTSIVIKKSVDGYTGPKGEHYSEFPKVSELKAVYLK